MNKFIKDVLLQGNVIRESSVDRKRTLICQAVLGNGMFIHVIIIIYNIEIILLWSFRKDKENFN